jgi:hypothetical protein
MARTEIDILVEAARKRCAVVEKDSHLLWTHEDVVEARAAGRYGETGHLLPPDGETNVSGLYPGCLQFGGALAEMNRYRAVGQTEHFVIFAAEHRA